MQTWGEAYRRLREQHKFAAWFGQHGQIPGPNDFTYKAFTLIFSGVTGGDANTGANAPVFGPVPIIFDRGCVVLGITSGAYQAQMSTIEHAPPDVGNGRRSLYKLFFGYTDEEPLTVLSTVLDPVLGAINNVQASIDAEALQGDGTKNEFPRDLLVPPSTGFFVSVQSSVPATLLDVNPIPPLFVHVVFHVLVPKG